MQRLDIANYIKEDIGMSLINKEVADFSAQAYVNDEFKTITKADILGKWSVFFFYPADFSFRKLDARYIQYLAILTLCTRHGTIIRRVLARLLIRCSLTLHRRSQGTLKF